MVFIKRRLTSSRKTNPRTGLRKRPLLELLEDRLAPSALTDPTPTVTSPQANVFILHKELSGFSGYGTADKAADIVSSKDSGSWTFNLLSVPGLDPTRVVDAQFSISGVLDDHYGEPSNEYVGTVKTDGVSQFSGVFPFAHGAPGNSIFTNWSIQTVPAGLQGPTTHTIAIANNSALASGDWIAIDYIELKLVLNQAPQITTQPASQTARAGQTVTFTAAGGGEPTPSLQWQVDNGLGFTNLTNGGIYSGITSNTLTITGVTSGVAGYQYRAVFSNGVAPDAVSLPATLTINPAATQLVISNVTTTSVTAGGTITFTLTAKDSAGQKMSSYGGTVDVTSTDRFASLSGNPLPALYTFVAGDNGSHTFTVTMETAGSRIISVFDIANPTLVATINPITVQAAAPATFSIATANVIEPGAGGTANMIFTVTRTGDLNFPVTVGYATIPGTAQPNVEFTPPAGTATFAPGSATAVIRIPVFGPNAYNHSNLTFSLRLNGIVGFGVNLTPKTDFATGAGPVSVVMNDLNGDGRPDAVVVNSGDNTVSVLRNTTATGANGPSFAAQQTFTTGTGPVAVAVADVNHDGKPDLVVADANGAGAVSVLLNTTPAGATAFAFAPHIDFNTGSKPVSVAAGDLNGDGNLDVVVANNGSDSVSVLLNTTTAGALTPSFAAHVDFATGTTPYSVALGDVNGDGKTDLVAANGGSNSVSVLLNKTAPGAGALVFAAKQDFATGTRPTAVAVGDLNADGAADLAVANAADDTVSVLFRISAPAAATLSFTAKQDFATGATPVFVAIKDFNGDSRPDLVVADSGSAANAVSVLVNMTPAGVTAATFAPQQTFATGSRPSALAVADINGDGEPDVVVADNGSGANTMSALLNLTVLTDASAVSTLPTNQVNFNSISGSSVIGDINGDGKADLIVTPLLRDYSVAVLVNKAAPGAAFPSFANPASFSTAVGPRFVTLGDINGDGRPDLVVVTFKDNTNNATAVFVNTTAPGAVAPTFASPKTFAAGGNERAAVVTDLNGDGKPDIAVINYGAYVSVLLNTTTPGATTPTFAAPRSFPTGAGSLFITSGDINGDGKPDLIAANFAGNSASVLLNTTAPGANTPTFANQNAFPTGVNPETIGIGDLNGDGRPDLVVGNENSAPTLLLNSTAPGALTPSFSGPTNLVANAIFTNVAMQDVNGDGKPDVVINNYFDGTTSLLVNTTVPGDFTPSFATQKINVLGRGTNSLNLGDLNGDGRPEAVVTTQGNSALAVVMNVPPDGPSATATAAINETAQFSVAGQTVNENAGSFSIPVTLSLPSPADTTIPFTVGGTAVSGTNYSSVKVSPLVIPAGQTSGTITGTVLDDGKFDADRTLTFSLGTPTNAVLGTTMVHTLRIRNIDPAPMLSFTSAAQRVAENAGTFGITVNLSAASGLPTTIPFTLGGTAVSGANYSGATASPLVIPPGQTSGTITGNVIDDQNFNPVNKTLTVTLGTPTNGTLGSPRHSRSPFRKALRRR